MLSLDDHRGTPHEHASQIGLVRGRASTDAQPGCSHERGLRPAGGADAACVSTHDIFAGDAGSNAAAADEAFAIDGTDDLTASEPVAFDGANVIAAGEPVALDRTDDFAAGKSFAIDCTHHISAGDALTFNGPDDFAASEPVAVNSTNLITASEPVAFDSPDAAAAGGESAGNGCCEDTHDAGNCARSTSHGARDRS